jgi:hypothetical protein
MDPVEGHNPCFARAGGTEGAGKEQTFSTLTFSISEMHEDLMKIR